MSLLCLAAYPDRCGFSASLSARACRTGGGVSGLVVRGGPSGDRTLALWFGQLGHVPAAPERFHQQDAGVHAASEDVDLVALVREGHGLRGDDLQVVVHTTPIAVGEELE